MRLKISHLGTFNYTCKEIILRNRFKEIILKIRTYLALVVDGDDSEQSCTGTDAGIAESARLRGRTLIRLSLDPTTPIGCSYRGLIGRAAAQCCVLIGCSI